MNFLVRAIVAGVGFWLASRIIQAPYVEITSLASLIGVALVLGLLNALVRPALIILTLPISILTLGLFLFVINGLTVWIAAWFVPGVFIRGLGPAILTAIIISVVSWIANFLFGGLDRREL